MRICKKCGGSVAAEDLYCMHCGAPLEKEAAQGRQEQEKERETAPPLSVTDYLLVGVLLLIPIVNLILPILWIMEKKGNPNRRNLAKAWLIFLAVGVLLGSIFAVGLLRAVEMDYLEERHHYYIEDIEAPEDMVREHEGWGEV